MGNRRHESVEPLVQEIKEKGNDAVSLPVDLTSLASVQMFAQAVKTLLFALDNRQIDVLIHNAGVSFINGPTVDGHQGVWQVNALSPYLLTELLLPNICRSRNAKVVYVSSEMHYFCWGKSIMKKCPPDPQQGASSEDYALSKACQVLQAYELTTRRKRPIGKNVRFMAVEPGLVKTRIGRHVPQQWLLQLEYFLLGPFLVRSVDQGCASILYCAMGGADEENDDDSHGTASIRPVYFANCRSKRPKSACIDPEEAQRWEQMCEELLKDYLE